MSSDGATLFSLASTAKTCRSCIIFWGASEYRAEVNDEGYSAAKVIEVF